MSAQKNTFLYKWVSDPEWRDAYFLQRLTLSETDTNISKGEWFTLGRLEQLIGEKEVKKALEEGWWDTKKGPSSYTLVFYTTETKEHSQSRRTDKELKGGTALEVEAGKKMIVDALSKDWSQSMMGIEAEATDEDEVPRETFALGVTR